MSRSLEFHHDTNEQFTLVTNLINLHLSYSASIQVIHGLAIQFLENNKDISTGSNTSIDAVTVRVCNFLNKLYHAKDLPPGVYLKTTQSFSKYQIPTLLSESPQYGPDHLFSLSGLDIDHYPSFRNLTDDEKMAFLSKHAPHVLDKNVPAEMRDPQYIEN